MSWIMDGATLGAGWGGHPSYQRHRPRPPDPLFFLSSGCRTAQQRLRRRDMASSESEREPRAPSSEEEDDRFILLGGGNWAFFLSL